MGTQYLNAYIAAHYNLSYTPFLFFVYSQRLPLYDTMSHLVEGVPSESIRLQEISLWMAS